MTSAARPRSNPKGCIVPGLRPRVKVDKPKVKVTGKDPMLPKDDDKSMRQGHRLGHLQKALIGPTPNREPFQVNTIICGKGRHWLAPMLKAKADIDRHRHIHCVNSNVGKQAQECLRDKLKRYGQQ